MNAKKMWKCGGCGTLSIDRVDADACCEADEVWVCGKCESNWDQDKEAAENCCKEE